MVSRQSIIFIMNPISGTAKKAEIPRLVEETLDKSIFDHTIRMTEYAGHAAQIAKEASDNGIDIVVAVGGDGTVNEVARSITGTHTALGIIPCGSGNGLARHLMLPMDYRKAIETINRCEIHDLDYGIINGKPFFCTCGMGFDAFISEKFAKSGKRGLKTYIENVFKEGIKYKPETYTIETGSGEKKTYKANLISCANASQYGNNAYIAPQASMSDGFFDVVIMEPFDLIEAPQVIMEMMNKTLNKNSRVTTFQSEHIIVHREKPGFIHYDGDPLMTDADVDIRLVRKGIRIIVNPDADKTKRKPNAFQTALSDFSNDITAVRDDITRQGRHIQEITNLLLNKINKF